MSLIKPDTRSSTYWKDLDDEIRHDTSVIRVHAWPERVEDARYANIHVALVPVAVHHGLGDTFSFVVAAPRTYRVYVPPVRLRLRMHVWIAINFAGAGKEHPRMDAFGEAQHVQGAHGARFDRLDGVVLVMRRRRRARQVIDLINLHHDGLDDVVSDQLEVRVVRPVGHVLLLAGEEIVNDGDVVAFHHDPC